MNDFSDFLNVVSEGKTHSENSINNKPIKDLSVKIKENSFLSFLDSVSSEELTQESISPIEEIIIPEEVLILDEIILPIESSEEIIDETPIVEIVSPVQVKDLSEKIKDNSFLSFLESASEPKKPKKAKKVKQSTVIPIEPVVEEIIPEIITEELPVESPKNDLLEPTQYNKLFKTKVDLFNQPNVPKVSPEMKAITDKLQYMENWISKISAAGPGGGEVNLRWLDDIDRPTIYDGRYLRYNDTSRKFEFAEVNPHDIVFTTHLVTTPTYSIDNDDYYVGVNYAGPVTITLPVTPSSGRMIIIKDESGHASINPIAVIGTVDNDTGGFILQLDNGGIQMIYRNGWRIV
jgi:hypothetical protein